jgi:hypothetical protein
MADYCVVGREPGWGKGRMKLTVTERLSSNVRHVDKCVYLGVGGKSGSSKVLCE